MSIAIMGRAVRPGITGVGRHVAGLIKGLARAAPQQQFTLFLTQDAPSFPEPNLTEVRSPFPTPNEYARALWEQTVVPWQVRQRQVELYHSPNYILPLALDVPSVVTVHDLTYLDADLHKWTSHHYLRIFARIAMRKARAIIAVSEHTKRRIEEHYPETRDRVHVIYQGLSEDIKPPCPEAVERFLQAVHIERPYILFVGTIEPRKNLQRLISAFERLVQEAAVPHHLYIVGGWGWKTHGVREKIRDSHVADRIHVTDYVPQEELIFYYAGAALFVYPSLEEGFGLPVAEAMLCGTPVVTSNCSALPEVAGDAAIKVDPLQVDAIAAGMAEVLTHEDLAAKLRLWGKKQAGLFTWTRAAQQHLDLYETVLKTL